MKSKLKKIMESKAISVRKLRELTSKSSDIDRPDALSLATITNARHDQRILSCSLGTLARIAAALDCRVKDLFEESDT